MMILWIENAFCGAAIRIGRVVRCCGEWVLLMVQVQGRRRRQRRWSMMVQNVGLRCHRTIGGGNCRRWWWLFIATVQWTIDHHWITIIFIIKLMMLRWMSRWMVAVIWIVAVAAAAVVVITIRWRTRSSTWMARRAVIVHDRITIIATTIVIAQVGTVVGVLVWLRIWRWRRRIGRRVAATIENGTRMDWLSWALRVGGGTTRVRVAAVVVGWRWRGSGRRRWWFVKVEQLVEQWIGQVLGGGDEEVAYINVENAQLIQLVHETRESFLRLVDGRILDFQVTSQQIGVTEILVSVRKKRLNWMSIRKFNSFK